MAYKNGNATYLIHSILTAFMIKCEIRMKGDG